MGPGQKKLAKLLAPKSGQRSPEDIKKDIVVGMRKIDPSYKLPDEKKQLNNSGGRYPVYSQYSVKEDEELKKFVEDVGTGAIGAPTNHTGMNVVGTGENQVHWSKRQPKMGPKGKRIKYGQPMLFKSFLRRKGMTNEQLKVWMKLHKEI